MNVFRRMWLYYRTHIPQLRVPTAMRLSLDDTGKLEAHCQFCGKSAKLSGVMHHPNSDHLLFCQSYWTAWSCDPSLVEEALALLRVENTELAHKDFWMDPRVLPPVGHPLRYTGLAHQPA